jgi:hypothetical protein
MTMTFRWIAALVVLLAGGSACAQNAGPATPAPERWTDRTEIEVDNGTPNSIRVYALEGGGETFLGRVDPLTRQSLRLPQQRARTIQLVAKPSVDLGRGQAHVSEPILISDDRRITWRLHASPGVTDLPRISTVHVLACGSADSC